MHAHCILPNCPESPIGNWENIRHVPQFPIGLTTIARVFASGKIAKAEKNNYSNFAAAAVLAVTLVLLALSLSHLATGIALVTGARPSDGWLMAIGIDLGFIALELAPHFYFGLTDIPIPEYAGGRISQP